jgi:hypothetical protein
VVKHPIPGDAALWKLENFEQFIAARKKPILTRMRELKLIVAEASPLGVTTVAQCRAASSAFATILPAE